MESNSLPQETNIFQSQVLKYGASELLTSDHQDQDQNHQSQDQNHQSHQREETWVDKLVSPPPSESPSGDSRLERSSDKAHAWFQETTSTRLASKLMVTSLSP